MNALTEGMAKAIDGAFEAGVTTIWMHQGYRYELKGKTDDTGGYHDAGSGYLLFSADQLDEMPIGIEIFDTIVANGKLYLVGFQFELSLTLEADA